MSMNPNHAVALLLCLLVLDASLAQDSIDHSREIAPLLDQHCGQCHGPQKQRGGFRVDVKASAFAEADSGERPIVPNNVEASELIRRIVSTDDGEWMPPDGPRMTSHEIEVLKRWIESGADWPASSHPKITAAAEMVVTEEDRQFWSFRPLSQKAPPAGDDEWIRNDVDRFVLQRLHDNQLQPNSVAAPAELLRRLSFDVVGLPPNESEVRRFNADVASGGLSRHYDRAVEQRLGSVHFGERWARHWMDVARYADSDGYEADKDRPSAYQYRDFVIRAFNEDLPFDNFVQWQIAGDELQPNDPRAVAATGFLSAGPVTNGGAPTAPAIVKKKARYDELDDIVSTTTQAFLGLTLACARCHDHKFDPIPTRDYYRLVSAFATIERRESQLAKAQRDLSIWIDRSQHQLLLEKITKLKCTTDEAKWLAAGPMPPAESKAAFKKYGKRINFSDAEWRDWLDAHQQETLAELEQAADEVTARDWLAEPALFVSDRSSNPEEVQLLRRGDVGLPDGQVQLGFLSVLTGRRSPLNYLEACQNDSLDSTFHRSAVALWMTDSEHGAGSLLARVIVNRIWHHYFGTGLVRTPNDFGLQGEKPTHPELLDWLASELIRNGWKLKPIHRLIVHSNTYRQSAQFDQTRSKIDPENRWLWRRTPKRLDSEAMRDALLSVSGRLNRRMFGSPIRPFIPSAAMATRSRDKWPEDIEEGPEHWRRSVYIFVKRSIRFPMMEAFDAPDPTASCGRRIPTTVPVQALTLLNNGSIREAARAFSQSLQSQHQAESRQIESAFQRAFGREPTVSEVQNATHFLSVNESVDPMADLCHALLISNEFVYVQ